MDRPKAPGAARGVKGKITQHPPDLFALGSKPTTSRDDPAKRSSSSHSKFSSSSHGSLSNPLKDRKREGTSSTIPSIPSKKPKVFPMPPGAKPSSVSLPSTTTTTPVNVTEAWESMALDTDEGDFVANVLNNTENDIDRAIGYFLGAIKLLRNHKFKPDPILLTSITFIVKMKPSLVRNDNVTQAVFGLLRKDSGTSFKSKGNPQVQTFAVTLLMRGYEDVACWPQSFFKVIFFFD